MVPYRKIFENLERRNLNFHPVVHLPLEISSYDFTQGEDPKFVEGEFGIGRYNEKRPGLYKTKLFGGLRYIHMGIDLFGPVGTPVFAPSDGKLVLFTYNSKPGDYGHTLITEHTLDGSRFYLLYGHLSASSLKQKRKGQKIHRGEILGWIGNRNENGGWAPHLHFQLSRKKPKVCDMPGVVSDKQLKKALQLYPDPRLILGTIY